MKLKAISKVEMHYKGLIEEMKVNIGLPKDTLNDLEIWKKRYLRS